MFSKTFFLIFATDSHKSALCGITGSNYDMFLIDYLIYVGMCNMLWDMLIPLPPKTLRHKANLSPRLELTFLLNLVMCYHYIVAGNHTSKTTILTIPSYMCFTYSLRVGVFKGSTLTYSWVYARVINLTGYFGEN